MAARIETATGSDRCQSRLARLGGDTYERALTRAAQRAHAVYPEDDEKTVAFGVVRFAIYAGVHPSAEDRAALAEVTSG